MLALTGCLSLLVITLFIWQHREHKKSAHELKLFQKENIRLVQQINKTLEQMEKIAQQRHEDHMAYFQGIMQSIARIIRKQEESEGS